jgi:hypothetical protein
MDLIINEASAKRYACDLRDQDDGGVGEVHRDDAKPIQR